MILRESQLSCSILESHLVEDTYAMRWLVLGQDVL